MNEEGKLNRNLPLFERPYRERVRIGWERFAKGEEELRALMDRKEMGDKLVACCSKMLEDTFAYPSFELGFHGGKYELIFSPEHFRDELYLYDAFIRQAPEALKSKWNFLLGKQRSKGMTLCIDEMELSAADVTVLVHMEDAQNGRRCGLDCYCEKLTELLEKNENLAYRNLEFLIDQAVGELVSMSYIQYFELKKEPLGEGSISLNALYDVLKQKFGEAEGWDGAAHCLEMCSAYRMKPNESEDAAIRQDVVAGSNSCMAMINEYYQGNTTIVDAAYANGAVPGFFCYPIWVFSNEEGRSDEVFEFRDELERYLTERAGEAAVTVVGGATGTDCGYLDFFAWDLRAVLNAAQEFFDSKEFMPWALFHTFEAKAQGIVIKQQKEKE